LALVSKSKDFDFLAENVAFHRLVVDMKTELKLESASDKWVKALPNPEDDNYEICVLFLMICTLLVPDMKIVEIFTPMFLENYVTLDWILEMGPAGITELLRPLGRQHDSSEYIYQAALTLKELGRFPRDYRELAKMKGVGSKVAIETILECWFGAGDCVRCAHMLNLQGIGLDSQCWIPTQWILVHYFHLGW
jgi:hypothetical protein